MMLNSLSRDASMAAENDVIAAVQLVAGKCKRREN